MKNAPRNFAGREWEIQTRELRCILAVFAFAAEAFFASDEFVRNGSDDAAENRGDPEEPKLF